MRYAGPRNCDRARNWLSLRLDGELSELEQALLAAHLARCEACRRFEGDVVALTAALRAAPVERLERPVALPRGRVAVTPLRVGVAAALAAAAVGLGAALSTLQSHNSVPSLGASSAGPVLNFDHDLRDLRRNVLKPKVPVLRIVRRGLASPTL